MALSNWLTRGEWNTAWLAGILASRTQKIEGLGEQLIAGMVAMHKAGYVFTGITIDDNGSYDKVTQCCGGNERVLAEMLTGEFDGLSRAKEAILWAKENIPTLDLSVAEGWIKEEENPS